jgi:predicted MPP superfamily phosphohydrolase
VSPALDNPRGAAYADADRASGAGLPMSDVPRITRRRFLRRAGWSTFGFVGAFAGLAEFGERNWPQVKRVRVKLAGLPPALEGLRICQISDLHRGPLVRELHLDRAVTVANRLQPDVTAVTGDFVSDSAVYAESCARSLSRLRARYGTYGVLGNHDYWTEDPEQISDLLTRAGLRMLTNESARLVHQGQPWHLCGADDMWSGKPDLGAALADVPDDAFRVLLAHEPDLADEAARLGVPLQLSGHSHGGQVLIPGLRPLILPKYGQKYPIGVQRVAGTSTQVYTNVGIGVIAVPIRINCPPEVTLLTLHRAEA